MTERRRVELDRGAGARLVHVGKAPAGIVLADVGERAERVELADGSHPAAHAMPNVTPPCVQREEDVEVPERQRLEDEVEDGRAGPELRQAEDAHQAAHARGRRYAGCAQPRLDVFEQRRAARRGRDMDEQARVALESVLSDVGAVELAVHPAGGGKRQDHAERNRHEPPGRRGRAGRVQQDQQPDCRGGQHDGHPQAAQRLHAERARALGPSQKRVELGPPHS